MRRMMLTLLFTGLALAQTPGKPSKPQPKITKEHATAIALTKVPNGKIKESELEREHGKLVWSFDISTPDSKDITEVQVDANSGAVVSVEMESPRAEAAERKKSSTVKSKQ